MGVATLLQKSIPVATLAGDPFTVCREGAHGVAWPAAVAFLLLLVGGVLVLGVGALWGAGRLKGVRRLCCSAPRLVAAAAPERAALSALRASAHALVVASPPRAPAQPPAQPPAVQPAQPTAQPAPVHASRAAFHLSEVLVDNSLRPPWAWLTFYQFLLTALCSGVVALTQRAASPAQFIALQALLIAATLGSAGLVARARPFLPRERWRAPVQVALYLLASASAAVNLVMRFAGEAAARGSLGWGLASTLLALAAGTLLLLFGGWWAALVARARSPRLTPSPPPRPPPRTRVGSGRTWRTRTATRTGTISQPARAPGGIPRTAP
jgi:hypothetical protein